MKISVKKTAATALSVIGMLSMMPSALCAPEGANNTPPQNNRRGHIDSFNIMVVGKYLNNVGDLFNLQMVNKKYENLLGRYHFNPVAITSREQLALFPNIETYRVGENGRDFVSTFPNDDVKELVYLPGSFNLSQFHEVLNQNGLYIDKGVHEVELNSKNPMDGFRITFIKDGKAIILMFDPCVDGALGNLEDYNEFLKSCGIVGKELDAVSLATSGELFISSSVTSIGKFAFKGCKGLEKVILPNSVKSIDGHAFDGCVSLANINIPSSVKSIGENAFNSCRSLNNVEIPSSVTSIGDGAFFNCFLLKNIKIPDSVERLGDYAFGCCINLDSVKIPASVTSIGEGAFSNCGGLTEIKIPDSVVSIGDEAFTGCHHLNEVTIPKSVTNIGKNAFRSCTHLNSINIPTSVTNIGESAFENCWNLREIEIPTSVENIGEYVFEGCESLNIIKFNGEVYNSFDSFMKAFNEYRASQEK